MSGPRETRPRLGLSPTRPQHAAGMRSEPPPSLPWASGTMPAATAAAEPPEEPPGVRVGSHGLRVGPVWRGSVVGRIPNSGRLVTPTTTKPGLLEAAHEVGAVARPVAGEEARAEVHAASPAAGTLALIAIGTPANGRASPRLDLARGLERPLAVDLDERVERRVERLDALERRLDELARATAARSARATRARPPVRNIRSSDEAIAARSLCDADAARAVGQRSAESRSDARPIACSNASPSRNRLRRMIRL